MKKHLVSLALLSIFIGSSLHAYTYTFRNNTNDTFYVRIHFTLAGVSDEKGTIKPNDTLVLKTSGLGSGACVDMDFPKLKLIAVQKSLPEGVSASVSGTAISSRGNVKIFGSAKDIKQGTSKEITLLPSDPFGCGNFEYTITKIGEGQYHIERS